MNWRKILNNRSIGDRKGQVAIFVALIFQLLFLFFAMVVNVGLLVHHKINLQNSVDLAAYYGAMKQAEVMNAVGHINYQIRQSYKLLAWRYRVLGTAGVYPTSTLQVKDAYNLVDKRGASKGVREGRITSTPQDGPSPDFSNYPADQDHFVPAFCIRYQPFQETSPGENTCNDARGIHFSQVSIPNVYASFAAISKTSVNISKAAQDAQMKGCDQDGPINYLALARFIAGFQIDQGTRKALLYRLANGLSIKRTSDFTDLEGNSASEGINNTLKNNLTAANRESIIGNRAVIFNSLGTESCGEAQGADDPPKWLSEIVSYMVAAYMKCELKKNDQFEYGANPISTTPVPPASLNGLSTEIEALSKIISGIRKGDTYQLYRPSLGVEKNPWCMAYVGVKASTKPKIPFSLSDIELKAISFAKPFGGKIGPWYGKKFPKASNNAESIAPNPEDRIDMRATPRCVQGNFANCTSSSTKDFEGINYSRYPGDQVGLESQVVQAYYGKSIFDVNGKPTLKYWENIAQFPNGRNSENDILAFENGMVKDQAADRMRRLEIAAIAPDLFDLTYYSIDPDFYGNYYLKRIDKALGSNPIQVPGGLKAVYDLGGRLADIPPTSSGDIYSNFGIKNQLEIVRQVGTAEDALNLIGFGLDFKKYLNYQLFGSTVYDTNDPLYGKLLTSWVPPEDITTYEMPTTNQKRFGACSHGIYDQTSGKVSGGLDSVPGGCIQGGRTGYSVKIISSDYLFGSYDLGNVGKDTILNPPTADFLK